MWKVLVALLLLGAGGLLGYRFLYGSATRRACSRMAELCGEKHDAKKCEDDFAELRKIGGDESLEKPAKCMAEAKTCGEAAGCYAGAIGNSGVKFFKDAFKGLTKSLDEK